MLGDLAVAGFGALVAVWTIRLRDRWRRRLPPRPTGALFGGLLLASGIAVASVGGAADVGLWALAVAVGLPIGGLALRVMIDFERANAARRREQEGRRRTSARRRPP